MKLHLGSFAWSPNLRSWQCSAAVVIFPWHGVFRRVSCTSSYISSLTTRRTSFSGNHIGWHFLIDPYLLTLLDWIVSWSDRFTWKFGLTIITSIRTASLIQWNDRISHPCNLIGPLNFFQAHEDCDRFRIANGTSPLLRHSHHKGHRSTRTTYVARLASDLDIYIELLTKASSSRNV